MRERARHGGTLSSCLLVALLIGAVSPIVCLANEPIDVRIGLFDQLATGGQGAAIDGLLRGLKDNEYSVERITNLQPLTLARFDVVYLSDMHWPGTVHAEWKASLTEYVEAGGSVLQTWHHHIFQPVGTGVARVYGSRRMHVSPGHKAIEGVDDFDARFSDHIIERVGPSGTVLLANDAGQAVAVAGTLGRGKVISTGLALAIPLGRTTAPPNKDELRLLHAFFSWLTPEGAREQRFAELAKTPRLAVSPPKVLTAAGFDATFRVDLAGPGLAEAVVTCPDAVITPLADEDPGVALRSFGVTVPTAPMKDELREITIRATFGEQVLEERCQIEAVYGQTPADEVRGVWLHVRPDRHPQRVMPELARLGINMAVLRIAGGTAAFYGSKLQPDIQDPLAPDGDWLAEAVKHAHANGIELHPYVNNCVVEGRSSRASLASLRAAGRLQEAPDGEPIDWFCPSQEINIEAIERPMLEIVSNYDVDGIQYDFIRYQNDRGCFCDKCRQRFEEALGEPVANWPEDCIGGLRHDAWVDYRAERISALVQRISTRIRQVNPQVKISAAVFRDWPDCREKVGQDWVRWCQRGWLDFVCPMNYTLDSELFAQRASVHRDALPAGFPIVQGIGIASGNGRMVSSEKLAVQIALARKHGAMGFVGFAYVPEHTSSLFGPLQAWLKPLPAKQ